MHLYMSPQKLIEALKNINHFHCLNIYIVPFWFTIQTKPLCTYGPKHLLSLIERSRYLNEDFKKVIDPVI